MEFPLPILTIFVDFFFLPVKSKIIFRLSKDSKERNKKTYKSKHKTTSRIYARKYKKEDFILYLLPLF